MELWLIRHGESTWNAERRFQGGRDVPLSAFGRAQAAALAERLRPLAFAALYTSPLGRARDTAEVCAAALGLVPAVVDDLREMGLGAWEGLTLEDARQTVGEAYRRWAAAPLDHPAPGAERLDLFAARVGRAARALAARHPTGRVLVVSHGGAIASLLCDALGVSLNALWRFRLENGSITRLVLAPPRVLAVNDTAHLAGLGNGNGHRDAWPEAGTAP